MSRYIPIAHQFFSEAEMRAKFLDAVAKDARMRQSLLDLTIQPKLKVPTPRLS